MAYAKTTWANTPSTSSPINATNLNKMETGIEKSVNGVETGWTPLTGTFTYASADAPTFVMNTPTNLTGVIGLGMRIKLTQTTVKYFIITAISSTTLTLYGGTDYTLTADTITSPFYSIQKSPFGFPTNPDKWSIIFTDTVTRSQATTTNAVYNLGGASISIPIGVWKVNYQVLPQIGVSTDTAGARYLTVGISDLTTTILPAYACGIAGGDFKFTRTFVSKTFVLTQTARRTYYFNTRNDAGGSLTIYNLNGESALIIRAECAYL